MGVCCAVVSGCWREGSGLLASVARQWGGRGAGRSDAGSVCERLSARPDLSLRPGPKRCKLGHYPNRCSGMSYIMDFEDAQKVTPDDMVVNYDEGSFGLVVDPKVGRQATI